MQRKNKRNLHLAIFSELHMPCVYHPVVITNFITLMFSKLNLVESFFETILFLKINKKHKYN
jgi:hypothetical protein